MKRIYVLNILFLEVVFKVLVIKLVINLGECNFSYVLFLVEKNYPTLSSMYTIVYNKLKFSYCFIQTNQRQI